MPSMASSSSNPNPSFSKELPNNVFLTFQTECRTIRFLQTSLRDAAIRTFIDNNQPMTLTLLETIKQSRIVILVFTKDLSFSRDCLDKLHKIMNCHNQMGKQVLPIFCGVSLLDAKQQVGGISELVKKGKLPREDFVRWRDAFADAASLPSWIMSIYCTR